MPEFDVAKKKSILLGPVGYQRHLRKSFEECRELNSLASHALAIIGCAVNCYLVDLVDAGRQLLEKAIQFLEAAIEFDERRADYEKGWTEASRLYHLTLARWMLSGTHDEQSLQEVIVHREQYYSLQKEPDTFSVACDCPEYLDACAYDQIVKLIDRTHGGKRVSMEAKYTLSVATNNGEDPSGGKDADRLFRRRFPDWLTRGHSVRVATWMKAVRWNHNRELRPLEVIRESLNYVTVVNDKS